MRTVSDLFDFLIHSISLLFISLIFLPFLLRYTFHYKNSETRWIEIHPKLRVDAYEN